MSLARKANDPQVSGAAVQRSRPSTPHRSLRRDLAELQRLMRVLQRHAPVDVTDCRRDLELLDDHSRAGRAEPHLRAVTALLVTLETYQSVNAVRQNGKRRDARIAARKRVTALVPPLNGRPVNGRHANGQPVNATPGDHAPAPSGRADTELAAAAAHYIARDLAARQLSEFTSAEGYRLARALAKIGRVEAQVERLLTDANQVRLHPMPLADAVSHSPR